MSFRGWPSLHRISLLATQGYPYNISVTTEQLGHWAGQVRTSSVGRTKREATLKSEDLTIEALRKRHTCSVEQASQILEIGRSTAYAAVRDGSLPVLRVRNRLLVPTAKLLAMLGVDQED